MIGAAGPLGGKITQTASRVFAKLPSVRGAQKAMDLDARRTSARQTAENAPQMKAMLQQEIASGRETLEKSGEMLAGLKGPKREALAAEFEKLRKGLAKSIAELQAMERGVPVEAAAAKITAGGRDGWGFATAFGGAVGAFMGDVTGGVTGASVGFLLHRMRAPMAERLAANPAFVRWASGLTGEPATAALSSFITQVVAQAASDADLEALREFSDMMSRVASEPLPSLGE